MKYINHVTNKKKIAEIKAELRKVKHVKERNVKKKKHLQKQIARSLHYTPMPCIKVNMTFFSLF